MSAPATVIRPASPRPSHALRLGTGELHQALEDARDLSRLHAFCSAHVCNSDDVSAEGLRLDPLKVFALMRSRGYQVAEPSRSPHQPRKGFTAWLVDIQLPAGPSVRLAFFTPNAS